MPDPVQSKPLQKLARLKQLKALKQPWLELYQLLGEFIHQRRMDFLTTQQAGAFLTREIFDTTAPKAAKTAASSILSMLWPNSVKRFRFKPPAELSNTRENKEYYEKITAKQIAVMDNPKAGLPMALDEYMLEDVVFGTSGVGAFPDKKTKVRFKPYGIKNICIAEDANGFVDTVYCEWKWPVHQIVKEYGVENVSPRVRSLFEKGEFDTEFDVLISVEPRITDDFSQARGNDAMPFEATHLEIESKKLLREGGYTEIPIKVGRFWKILGEVMGRSPGMDALPSTLEANAIWEAVTVAIEKNLDPPLGVLDDGKLGGGEIDTSAGAVNVFNITGRAGEKNPIFPLYTVGEIKQTVNLLQELSQDISDHFFIDRLLDFNNETRMTLGEANIRNKLRNSTLGSIFTRQIAEVFSPLIERVFNILFEAGEFGVINGSAEHQIAHMIGENPIIIPDEVAKLMLAGKDVYQIEYFTPALRVMQAEELDGIYRTWQSASEIAAAGVPEVLDNLDADESIRRVSNIAGAPTEILRAEKDIEEMRAERDRIRQQQMQLEQAKQTSEALRNVGQSNLFPTAVGGEQLKKAA